MISMFRAENSTEQEAVELVRKYFQENVIYSKHCQSVICLSDKQMLSCQMQVFSPQMSKDPVIFVHSPARREKDFFETQIRPFLLPSQTASEAAESTEVDVTPESVRTSELLLTELLKNEAWLGQKPQCYSIEKKTRTFVDQVFKAVFTWPVWVDMEVELLQFGKLIKPDYQIMLERGDGSRATPLLIVEVKRTEKKNATFKTELEQHFEQLRFICIEHQLSGVHGLITDFKDWRFTHFDFSREIEHSASTCQSETP